MKSIYKIILIVLSVFCLFSCTNKNDLQRENIILREISVNYMNQFEFSNIELSDSIFFLLFNDNIDLVFRIPESSCLSCINRELDLINSINNQSIIIVTAYSKQRDFTAFRNSFPNQLHVINIPQNSIPYDKLNKPYYFVIDKNKNIDKIFFPLESSKTFTKLYFEAINFGSH